MTNRPMTNIEWRILAELDQGTLVWGAVVSAVWPNLVGHGYVEPNFGPITDKGRAALHHRFQLENFTSRMRPNMSRWIVSEWSLWALVIVLMVLIFCAAIGGL